MTEQDVYPGADRQGRDIGGKIAKGITVILHPLIIPFIGCLLILYGPTYLSILPNSMKLYIVGVFALTTCIFPVLTIGILRSLRIIPGTFQHSRQERIISMSCVLAGFLICFYLLQKYLSIGIFPQLLIGAMLVVLICLGVGLFYKVSTQMSCMAGLIAVLTDLTFKGYGQMYGLLIVAILLTGALGTAQLYLGRHTIWQVLAGTFIGFGILLFALNAL